ncbi:MAG: cysteine dioxygenase [Acidimicrobiales bacterium]
MEQRTSAVQAAMDDIRRIEASSLTAEGELTRAGVEQIRDRLVELAGNTELFPVEDFPPPPDDEARPSYLYRLAQDADDRYALYAQSSRGSVSTPVHNHTTWAVVVGFDGQELNRFFRRSADGVEQTHQHMVEAGTGVAMLADDLHSIHIEGSALNFHCYGLALERLDEREYYDPNTGNWKHFSNVSGIREARSGLQSC